MIAHFCKGRVAKFCARIMMKIMMMMMVIMKAKQSHNTSMEAQGKRIYSSYSFTSSAPDGLSGQRHSPAALYLRERTLVPIVQEAGWAPEPVWTQRLEEKSFRLCWRSNLGSPGHPVRSQTLY
jgi:hypothetical protein